MWMSEANIDTFANDKYKMYSSDEDDEDEEDYQYEYVYFSDNGSATGGWWVGRRRLFRQQWFHLWWRLSRIGRR